MALHDDKHLAIILNTCNYSRYNTRSNEKDLKGSKKTCLSLAKRKSSRNSGKLSDETKHHFKNEQKQRSKNAVRNATRSMFKSHTLGKRFSERRDTYKAFDQKSSSSKREFDQGEIPTLKPKSVVIHNGSPNTHEVDILEIEAIKNKEDANQVSNVSEKELIYCKKSLIEPKDQVLQSTPVPSDDDIIKKLSEKCLPIPDSDDDYSGLFEESNVSDNTDGKITENDTVRSSDIEDEINKIYSTVQYFDNLDPLFCLPDLNDIDMHKISSHLSTSESEIEDISSQSSSFKVDEVMQRDTRLMKESKELPINKRSFKVKRNDYIKQSKNSSRKLRKKTVFRSNFRYKVDDLVIGKILKYGWWFGKVVRHTEKKEKDHAWVYWYGDHKILPFPTESLVSYTEFYLRFNKSRLRQRNYKKAVSEFLEDAYKAMSSSFTGRLNDHDRFRNLLQWALDGFCSTNHVNALSKVHLKGSVKTNYPPNYNHCDTQAEESSSENDEEMMLDSSKAKPENNENFFDCVIDDSFENNISDKSDVSEIVEFSSVLHNVAEVESQDELRSESDISLTLSYALDDIDNARFNDNQQSEDFDSKNNSKVTDKKTDKIAKNQEDKSGESTDIGDITLTVDNVLRKTDDTQHKREELLEVDFMKESMPLKENSITNKPKGFLNTFVEIKSCTQEEENSCDKQFYCPFERNLRKRQFQVNDLVIGDLKRFGWWFGKIVRQRKTPKKGFFWVRWYGDHRINEISEGDVEDITSFSKRFKLSNMKKAIYKKAVREFLFEASQRYSKNHVFVGNSTWEKHSQFKHLLNWALLGFKEKVVDNSGPKLTSTPKHSVKSCKHETDLSIKTDTDKENIEPEKKMDQEIGRNIKQILNEISEKDPVLTDINTTTQVREIICEDSLKSDDISKNDQNSIATFTEPLVDDKSKEKLDIRKKKRSLVNLDNIIEIPTHFSTPPKRKVFIDARKALTKKQGPNKEKTGRNENSKDSKKNQNLECEMKESEVWLRKNLPSVDKKLSGQPLSEDVSDGRFRIHDLVIGNVKGFGWWFGKIVSHLDVKQRQPLEGCCWVFWFGDHSVNEMYLNTLEKMTKFLNRFDKSQMAKRLYAKAVHEVLIEVVDRLPPNNTININDVKSLLNWANNNFQPTGIYVIYEQGSKKIDQFSDPIVDTSIDSNATIEYQNSSLDLSPTDSDKDLLKEQKNGKRNLDTEENQNKLFQKKRKRGKTNFDGIDNSNKESQSSPSTYNRILKIGDLVIGKLARFDWWFGKIISYKLANQSMPGDGNCWIIWYGDRKVSEMPIKSLEPLDNFSSRFMKGKVKGVYEKAVRDVLTEAAKRCSKKIMTDTESSDYVKELIDWALGGFKPTGVEPIYTCSEDDKSSDDNSSTCDDSLLDISKTNKKDKNTNKSGITPMLSSAVKKLFDLVAVGNKNIEELCLACGDTKIEAPHPLFEGGLCKECQQSFMENAYLFDEDGYQMFCTICSDGQEILLCDREGCLRSYCTVCIDMFCGVGYSSKISKDSGNWECFICTGKKVGILKRRNDWQARLKEIFQTTFQHENFAPIAYYETIPMEKRKPIRVLALFDGIATGCLALNQVGIDIEVYYASEIDADASNVARVRYGSKITHVGDVRNIYKKQLDEWGPFDLLIGGSPCNDLSIANPLKKGIFGGSGRLFFEFYRIKELLLPHPIESRPFFWLFENVVGMRYEDKEVITRFLQCNPILINSKDVSAQQRSRYFWGNLPGMNRQMFPTKNDRLNLQDCLEPNCGRVAKMDKVRCITTRSHSLIQTKKAILPVKWDSAPNGEDWLWLTEVERIFGFPEHYTDVGNMGRTQRLKLLGKSWSVPVISQLFTPLKNYFKTL